MLKVQLSALKFVGFNDNSISDLFSARIDPSNQILRNPGWTRQNILTWVFIFGLWFQFLRKMHWKLKVDSDENISVTVDVVSLLNSNSEGEYSTIFKLSIFISVFWTICFISCDINQLNYNSKILYLFSIFSLYLPVKMLGKISFNTPWTVDTVWGRGGKFRTI